MRKLFLTAFILVIQVAAALAQKQITITGLLKTGGAYNVCYHGGKFYVNYMVSHSAFNSAQDKWTTKVVNEQTMTEDNASASLDEYGSITIFYDLLISNVVAGADRLRFKNLKTGDEIEQEIPAKKGWNTTVETAYDPAGDRYYFFVSAEEAHYWTKPKSENFVLIYDVATKNIDKKEINKDQDGLSIATLISPCVVDNKAVFKGYYKGSTVLLALDFEGGDAKVIKIDQDVKNILDISVVRLGQADYLVFYQGRVSSQGSSFYQAADFFKLDVAGGTATHVGPIPTGSGPGIYARIADADTRRLAMNIFLVSAGHYYMYDVSKEKLTSYLFHDGSIDARPADVGTSIGMYDIKSFEMKEGIAYFSIDGSGTLGGKKVEVQINGTTGEVTSKEQKSSIKVERNPGKYYCNGNEDRWLNIREDKGTLILSTE